MAITATKRLQEIVDLLDQKGYVKAKELSQKYQVSMETIRKDLTFLEEKGVVIWWSNTCNVRNRKKYRI